MASLRGDINVFCARAQTRAEARVTHLSPSSSADPPSLHEPWTRPSRREATGLLQNTAGRPARTPISSVYVCVFRVVAIQPTRESKHRHLQEDERVVRAVYPSLLVLPRLSFLRFIMLGAIAHTPLVLSQLQLCIRVSMLFYVFVVCMLFTDERVVLRVHDRFPYLLTLGKAPLSRRDGRSPTCQSGCQLVASPRWWWFLAGNLAASLSINEDL